MSPTRSIRPVSDPRFIQRPPKGAPLRAAVVWTSWRADRAHEPGEGKLRLATQDPDPGDLLPIAACLAPLGRREAVPREELLLLDGARRRLARDLTACRLGCLVAAHVRDGRARLPQVRRPTQGHGRPGAISPRLAGDARGLALPASGRAPGARRRNRRDSPSQARFARAAEAPPSGRVPGTALSYYMTFSCRSRTCRTGRRSPVR